jgi:hypothetical protein
VLSFALVSWTLLVPEAARSDPEGPAARRSSTSPRCWRRRGAQGTFSFSSESAARSCALFLREKGHHLTPNLVAQPQAVLEHPLVQNPRLPSDYLDFATRLYMTDAGVLSVGVVRTWEYLRQIGLSPADGIWQPATVAIIDQGFALDPVTGLPENAILDDNVPFELIGTGFDSEDGELTGDSLEWYGSRDGFLGTGSPLTAVFTGAQTLTLRAIDSDGNVGVDEVSFTLNPN